MPKRNTYRYTMRYRNRIQEYGVTNNPTRRVRENRREGVRGGMRIEGPRVTRRSALSWERRRITTYRRLVGRRPPRNRT